MISLINKYNKALYELRFDLSKLNHYNEIIHRAKSLTYEQNNGDFNKITNAYLSAISFFLGSKLNGVNITNSIKISSIEKLIKKEIAVKQREISLLKKHKKEIQRLGCFIQKL